MTTRCIGFDSHKREATFCIIDSGGKELLTRTFALTRETLLQFARTTLQPTDRLALEATTNCWIVAELLQPFVAEVVVSNPLATKAIASAKVKTDKVDAQVLAQLLRCDYLPRVWQPDAVTQQLRQLTGRRATLVQQRTALRNRIHSVLAMRLIAEPETLFGSKGRDWLRTLLREERIDVEGRLLIESDLDLLEHLQRQIDRLDLELLQRGYRDHRVQLLLTLPGVDAASAETLLAALGDVSRFQTPEKAAAYLGLVPSTRQSAKRCYHGPITKRGNTQARWMLVQAAQSVERHPGPLGAFFRRLKRKKNHNVAVVAVARKLVMIAWHMLTTGEPYRYAQPNSTQQKLARLRIKATGGKRKTGPPKGARCVAKLPGGSRTVKPLAQVYAEEGVPPRVPLSPGEQRMVHESGTAEFVESLDREHVVPIAGNATLIRIWHNMIRNGLVNLLVAGPSRTGKTRTMYLGVRALLCTNRTPTQDPCGCCPTCRAVPDARGDHYGIFQSLAGTEFSYNPVDCETVTREQLLHLREEVDLESDRTLIYLDEVTALAMGLGTRIATEVPIH